ncbi:DUF815 domain-containing protein [Erythrobacter sp. HKB08]|uniref:DUF815 domain-containing protein n=1 Tax=Erythrobacter sp. HKB08 TaxID=2502843 RepID=UPI001008B6EF|nr:DUF815 domain-containing protein [Erythrobacter sp. HKB08]
MARDDASRWSDSPAYVWAGSETRGIERIDAPPLDLMRGIDRQKASTLANVERHAKGVAAHDMLLWGSRGMGKSALVRSVVADVQERAIGDIALIQLSAERIDGLPALFRDLAQIERRFLVYVDDLGFVPGSMEGPRRLRSLLEGGIEARPDNVRLAVTSNYRAILSREMDAGEQRHARDRADDELALADRFGLVLGFHACSQDDYLAIVAGYAERYGLDWSESDAIEWAAQRGARSGRTAWQYITEIAGRAGKALANP